QLVEEPGVGLDDVPAGVEAEDLELGPHPLLRGHLREAAHLALPRRVAEVAVARDWAAAFAHTPGSASGCRSSDGAPSRVAGSELLRAAASSARARAGVPAAGFRPARPRPRAARSTARACRSSSATWSSRSRRVTLPRRRTPSSDPSAGPMP